MTGARIARSLAAVLIAAALVACETAPSRAPLPELTYGHLPPIALDVARIEVVELYRAPGHAPNVEHEMPVAPATTAGRWARDRLRAVGRGGRASFVIVRASVVEVPLPRRQGLGGTFTVEQAERYDAALEVRLDVVSADGRRRGHVTARTGRSQTVPEDITLNDRERVWFAMTEALMSELNAKLEAGIRQHLGQFAR